jgi:hypothetical protein
VAGDATIRECIVALLAARSPQSSICPSEVARTLHGDESAWRAAMPQVRRVAAAMVEVGMVDVT